jgi:hypothetical protein
MIYWKIVELVLNNNQSLTINQVLNKVNFQWDDDEVHFELEKHA